ncbi:MAG: DUF438 domain-containing protein [Peptoniphilus sp.]|nr:DUF438 domain-containing protein [Peptoniphilus sp.]MDD7362848.1 DUF438 domain-containing protein [Bacillota bacterium]MDY6043960.1 DUF438 domain-containing protein [Peptoniphilus sp.]
MRKVIDPDTSIFESVRKYPELIEIMDELGFSEIKKKGMLNSVGKIMTLKKGAKLRHVPMDKIENTLKEAGFELSGLEKENKLEEKKENKRDRAPKGEEGRKERLKSYLIRLEDKEDLEIVRKDFVKNFSNVEPAEIMEAEQDLIEEGMGLEKVQRLCDLHSALFHGNTLEEKIRHAEEAVTESFIERNEREAKSSPLKADRELSDIKGHPLYAFSRENDHIEKILEEYSAHPSEDLFHEITKLPIHYSKKGDLLYPLLKVTYDMSGPHDVMWKVDDEIRDELSELKRIKVRDAAWKERLENVLERAEEMVYKERNILFPICADKFSDDEWREIYRDLKGYAWMFDTELPVWEEGETLEAEEPRSHEGRIELGSGSLEIEEIQAVLNIIPSEITFVDRSDINRYFNDGEGLKVFKRPKSALGRDVYSSHPAHIEPMVRSIIDDFKSGKRDVVEVWTEKNDRIYLVRYMAVRDKNKNYLGTLELVDDMEKAREYFKSGENEK